MSDQSKDLAGQGRGTGAEPYRIMTVCTGNICRSPMAEIVLRARFEEAGLGERVTLASSGVSDEEYGNPIDRRAVRVLKERGYQLPSRHFAHRIDTQEIAETDLFLPMTASHMRSLRRLLPAEKQDEVRMYRSFDPKLPVPTPGREDSIDLVDPWYGGPEDFEVAIDQVEEVAPHIVDWVAGQLQASGD
ncbi:phosphotyrosine protein phosphatase [Bifidobacterium aemilianum]|uniref:protein-tyrosine-phosphatase n=1 Tax=Bifidobacterium aemilianum TaxID=2493120 RepID=A0A366K9Q7_9BIFI|nr:low molecular weight protein-tyrosine-phosphatase [Bifidobacterium aemilianum]RBP97391.1 phosphotyrosine protein phosphatase [Bifidobacterium aemilianum]